GPGLRPPHPRTPRRHPRPARPGRARARQGVPPARPGAPVRPRRVGRHAAGRRPDRRGRPGERADPGARRLRRRWPGRVRAAHPGALATVADVVPLTGENRILVRHGLKLLAASHWTGVRALVDTAGLGGKPIKAGHVGFILAPRLNAAGRIGDAMDGLRLLLSDDPDVAAAIARELETLNARRQELDQRILDEAVELAERVLRPEDHALVLAADAWHPGVS